SGRPEGEDPRRPPRRHQDLRAAEAQREGPARRAAGGPQRAAVRLCRRHGRGAARRARLAASRWRMTWVDVAIVVIFLFFIVTAFSAGLVREIISTSATI